MTLVEVIFALAILAMLLMGILATMIQSRRLTETSISQTLASTIAQSYMEQLKGCSIAQLANWNANSSAQLGTSYLLPNFSADNTADPMYTSTGTPPALTSLTPGVTPGGGAVDNFKDYNPNAAGYGTSTSNATTWAALWPGGSSSGFSAAFNQSPQVDDLHMNFWIWIYDFGAASTAVSQVYGITIIYTWQVRDGGRVYYKSDTLHSIRSNVQSYSAGS